MSAAFFSSPNPSPRTRVTEVCRQIDASAIDSIMAQGDTVLIRFATKHGIEVVRCPRWSFIEKAQSPVDHHGHPFRGVATDMAALMSDADQVPVTKGNPIHAPVRGTQCRGGRSGLSIEIRTKLRATFEAIQRGEDSRDHGDIAAELGIHRSTVSSYFRQFSNEATADAPITKPNGKIL